MAKIDTLVVHHTATPKSWTVERVRKLHVEGNGWRDIGYHYVISLDPDGQARVYMGRPQDGDDQLGSGEMGAHVLGHNAHSLGISTIGNWSDEVMPVEIERVLVRELVSLCLRLKLKPLAAVKGHREMSGASTECPGKLVDMDRLRGLVDKRHKAVKATLRRSKKCKVLKTSTTN